MTQNFQTTYDNDFDGLTHYKRYPQMKPWIGHLYGKQYRKTLFIGESHYLPESSSIHLDIEKWYNSTLSSLSSEESDYTNTRDVVNKNYNNNMIFTYLAQELAIKNILPPGGSSNIFEYFSFYNFFLRPAYYGESLRSSLSRQDIDNANELFIAILKILKPEIVIFLSSLAWDNLNEKENEIRCDFVPHPNSWDRMGKQMKYSYDGINASTAREKLGWLISNYII